MPGVINQQSSVCELSLQEILASDYKSLVARYPEDPGLQKKIFALAEEHRRSLNVRPIVIAGSNGKTSVKEIVAEIFRFWERVRDNEKAGLSRSQTNSLQDLSTNILTDDLSSSWVGELKSSSDPQLHLESQSDSRVVVSPDNQNTKTALAMQILRLKKITDYAIFEVGARSAGDLQMAYRFLAPHTAVLLNIGHAHLGEFGSHEVLVQEKLSALQGDRLQNIVYFYDDPRMKERVRASLAERNVSIADVSQKDFSFEGKQKNSHKPLKVYSFGYESGSDVQVVAEKPIWFQSRAVSKSLDLGQGAKDAKVEESEVCMQMTFKVRGELFTLNTAVMAPQMALNFAAAWATALAYEIPNSIVLQVFENFKGVSRRFERHRFAKCEVIDDAFNSSPESLAAGLETLGSIVNAAQETNSKKVLLIIGSMLELGDRSEILHQEMGRLICRIFGKSIESKRTHVVFVGPETKPAVEICRSFLDKNAVLASNQLKYFDSVQAAQNTCVDLHKQVDLVYLKGSKSTQLQNLLSVFQA